jgi:hypothetical protein
MFFSNLLKIFLIAAIFANANGNLNGGDRFDCRSQQILEGSLPSGSKKWSMDTLKPILASNAIPWPETAFNIPQVKFAAKKTQSASSQQDQKLVLLLGLQASSDTDKSADNKSLIFGKSTNISSALIDTLDVGSIFNCFIDRSSQNPCNSGLSNPRCCYDNDYSSIHQEMSPVYPACKTSSCPDLQRLAKEEENPYTFSCRAVCSYDAILQVEFADNDMKTAGGETSLSMSSHRIALIQKNGEFIEIHEPIGEAEKAKLLAKADVVPMALPSAVDENGVRNPKAAKSVARAKLSQWFYSDVIPTPTDEEMQAAAEHAAHELHEAESHLKEISSH